MSPVRLKRAQSINVVPFLRFRPRRAARRRHVQSDRHGQDEGRQTPGLALRHMQSMRLSAKSWLTSSLASPLIPLIGSMSCCHGTAPAMGAFFGQTC